ncbi:protein folding regulator [Anaeramoeba ignava]|uniref:Protein folding regulator n=1 Tax=Anaeramoeba ignava TaxID=1746090 RepID=A0A9Q0LJJ3_ANAIG|nr:protein folding regulator [Anaeramoeba ignava]
MEDLLKWSLANSNEQNLNEIQNQMSEEEWKLKKQIFNEVMSNLIVDETEEMKKCIEKLKTEKETSIINDNLESLQEFVENIDNANNLDKLGGVDIVANFLNAEDPTIKSNALYVIGTCAKNNIDFQNLLLNKKNILDHFISSLKSKAQNVQTRAISATSAFVENNYQAQKWFLSNQVLELMIDFLSNGIYYQKMRIFFFFYQLVQEKKPEISFQKIFGESKFLIEVVAKLVNNVAFFKSLKNENQNENQNEKFEEFDFLEKMLLFIQSLIEENEENIQVFKKTQIVGDLQLIAKDEEIVEEIRNIAFQISEKIGSSKN